MLDVAGFDTSVPAVIADFMKPSKREGFKSANEETGWAEAKASARVWQSREMK